MERLVWHMLEALSQACTVSAIGPAGCKKILPKRVTGKEIPFQAPVLFMVAAGMAALREAVRFRPDAVVAGSGLCAPLAWIAARMTGARCIVYLHGLDIETKNILYRVFWKSFIRRCDQVIVNSRFTKATALQSGIPNEHIRIVHPGVTLPDMSRAGVARKDFRRRYGLGDAPLLVYVGRVTPRKGLAPFIGKIFPHVAAAIPDTRLLVIGDEPSRAILKQPGEMPKVHQALAAHGLQDRVLFLGQRAVDDPDISTAYFAADVHVFPVRQRKNDNEGFGMVAIEAAAHGCPTVAFAVGGVADAVQHGQSGYLVSAGDDKAFAEVVIRILASRSDQSMVVKCRRFAANFEWAVFGEKLRSCILKGGE